MGYSFRGIRRACVCFGISNSEAVCDFACPKLCLVAVRGPFLLLAQPISAGPSAHEPSLQSASHLHHGRQPRRPSSRRCPLDEAACRTVPVESSYRPRTPSRRGQSALGLRSESSSEIGTIAPAVLAIFKSDNGADERVAPPLDVGDVSVAKLAVAKRLADGGNVDSEAPLLNSFIT
jgi:hypothetical protein